MVLKKRVSCNYQVLRWLAAVAYRGLCGRFSLALHLLTAKRGTWQLKNTPKRSKSETLAQNSGALLRDKGPAGPHLLQRNSSPLQSKSRNSLFNPPPILLTAY
jgi:hypothetical protein